MTGGPYMLKALIILTLVLGSASLLLWLAAGDRPVQAQRTRPARSVPGRVVGVLQAPLWLGQETQLAFARQSISHACLLAGGGREGLRLLRKGGLPRLQPRQRRRLRQGGQGEEEEGRPQKIDRPLPAAGEGRGEAADPFRCSIAASGAE